MKRRKLPSFKEHAEEHHKRTNAYVERHVSRLSEEMVRDTIRTLELLGIDVPKDEALSLMDYPELRQPLANIRKRYAEGLETTIVNGAVREWAESNNLQDLFVRRVLKERGQDERAERFIHYFKPNTEARNAFIKRKEQGLGLSDKVWNVSGLMQSNLEQSLATAIEDGWDAVTLSKRVSQYLRDFPTMQRDYRLRYGRASRIEDAEYRSARLARTEINMAYRRAEQVRWADMDFVVGYEIKRSGRGYSCSVCDALAGKYPKDFVWHTWHPNCRCYAVPILNTDDEFFASPLETKSTSESPSINEVTDTPEGFRSWLSTNEHRIVQARERGTLPYFIRHNPKYSSTQKKKDEEGRKEIRLERHFIREEANKFVGQIFRHPNIEKGITLSKTTIKEWLNQPHRNILEKNRKLLDIGSVIERSTYLGNLPDKHNPIVSVYLLETLELGGQLSWLILREFPGDKTLRLYSVTDSDTMAKLIK